MNTNKGQVIHTGGTNQGGADQSNRRTGNGKPTENMKPTKHRNLTETRHDRLTHSEDIEEPFN